MVRLTTTLLEVLEHCSTGVQRDIIAAIPDIVDEKYHQVRVVSPFITFQRVLDTLDSYVEASCAVVLDTLSNLNLTGERLVSISIFSS